MPRQLALEVLAIDFATMTDFDYYDSEPVAVDFVDDPVIPDSCSIETLTAFQFFDLKQFGIGVERKHLKGF